MSKTSDAPVRKLGPGALRVVLFGMPDAGKSSLLGALGQAAQTQEHLLNGHLTDLSEGLGELQQRVYDEKPRETLDEVVPYPVAFEPFDKEGQSGGRQGIELIDCDGRVANELLTRRRSLQEGGREQGLAREILEADGLILAVDAAASPLQVEADFAEFGRFLRVLERSRGRRSDVGGLPVFLVLTKCDLLAEKKDSASTWMERIEERKRQVDDQFHEFLRREEDESHRPFGRIDMHLWATAVKRPTLAGSAPRTREPYGVAELFRQCFDYARLYRARRALSSRRLVGTVTGALATVAGMLLLAVVFFLSREGGRSTGLEGKVEAFRSNEGQTASVRLEDKTLQRNISVLNELKNDREFDKLPQELQNYVRLRLQEFQDYRSYRDSVLDSPAPALARNERELDRIEVRLRDEVAPPAEYRAEWSQTRAALLHAERLEDVKAIRAAVARTFKDYAELDQRGKDLLDDERRLWPDWCQAANEFLASAGAPAHPATDKVRGSSTVTYETIYRFDQVASTKADWERTQQRLERLSEVAAALGLVGEKSARPALLKIPAPKAFTPSKAEGLLQKLDKAYPRLREERKLPADQQWLRELPDVITDKTRRAELVREAGRSWKNLLDAGQEAILAELRTLCADGKETVERWQEVGQWLARNAEFRALGDLAGTLARLQGIKPDDPVHAMIEFLRQKDFLLELGSWSLEIPEDLKLRPVGQLTVEYQGSDTRTLAFDVRDSGQKKGKFPNRLIVFTLRPASGGTRLNYRPGDVLWAELTVRRDGDNTDWKLTWDGNRSRMYQLERLAREPQLHRKEQKPVEGKLAEKVQLTDGQVPPIPDLMPVVKLPGK